MPFLFASLKVGISASLVGAIVGELPTGAVESWGKVIGWFILWSNDSNMVSFDNGCDVGCGACWHFGVTAKIY